MNHFVEASKKFSMNQETYDSEVAQKYYGEASYEDAVGTQYTLFEEQS